MANVLHKTRSPADYRVSVNTPDFPSADWFHDPDVSAVSGVAIRYWKVGTNPVQEMTQPEKDAIDATLLAANRTTARSDASISIDGLPGYQQRALAAVLVDEINLLRQWITSFKAAVAAATSFGNLQTRVAALPNVPDRTLSQAKTAYKTALSNGRLDE